MRFLERFREVWIVDFEYYSEPGERPVPVCMVAHEMRCGQKLRLWKDQFGKQPSFGIGPDSLFVAYYSPAELGCFLALGWPTPTRILDLFVEFRNATNGWPTLAGNSLLGALAHFGLDGIGAGEKEQMRELILSGGPWSGQERRDILDYCESDVDALSRLLPVMLPGIDLPRALYRGRYMAAVAAMEWFGVPVNRERLSLLRENWVAIQDSLIARIDSAYQVFDGRTFNGNASNTGWWPTRSHGQGWKAVSSISTTTPFGKCLRLRR
jgi:DNA polymerase-1